MVMKLFCIYCTNANILLVISYYSFTRYSLSKNEVCDLCITSYSFCESTIISKYKVELQRSAQIRALKQPLNFYKFTDVLTSNYTSHSIVLVAVHEFTDSPTFHCVCYPKYYIPVSFRMQLFLMQLVAKFYELLNMQSVPTIF